ncbi:Uncharacterised protein [Vibrio cholerae]|uniref:Uncharacterized protein n=1 Tax=Vibrio cholerae TaxID=666 RepID=A0A655NR32_VIBCL|nr:Uncharacterised protein [Vibrio cholerae]
MSIQDRMYAAFDLFIGELCTKAEVKLHIKFTGDDIRCASTRLQVRNLKAGGGEIGVTFIPLGGGEFGQCGERFMHGIISQMRISNMALSAFYLQIPRDGATTAIFHHIAYG